MRLSPILCGLAAPIIDILVLFNRSSGRGRAERAARHLLEWFDASLYRVTMFAVGPGCDEVALREQAKAAGLVVIVGGDGTVHHSLRDLVGLRTPIYAVPMGTENLFAREFGMTREPASLHAALGVRTHENRNGAQDDEWIGVVEHCDVGYCNGRPFALMVSAGFDAHVVERVARSRTSSISRLAYVLRGVEELAEFRTPRFTVTADGQPLVDDRSGIVLVANSRQYAARLDPARCADMTDGLLDVIFIPFSSRLGMVRRTGQMMLGAHLRDAGFVRTRARAVRIESSRDGRTHDGGNEGVVYQVDGELCPPGERTPLEIRVEAGVLPVLSPRAAARAARGQVGNPPQFHGSFSG